MMTAAVYYVGGPDPDGRNELRHSLRTVTINAPIITEAWVVGDVPSWFTGVKMPLPPHHEKFTNARQSIETFVSYPGAPDQFYLFMDDIYITEPVTGSLPVCHLGSVKEYRAYREGRNAYARGLRDMTRQIESLGKTDPLAYLAHTPVLLNTEQVRVFLDSYPRNLTLEPFLLYPIAGIGSEGRRTGNAKCKRADSLEKKLAQDIPYLSSSPDTWAGSLGTYIREQFPDPCKYEEA